jgi:hypothetical protein
MMKRLSFLLALALLTFGLGVGAASGYARVAKLLTSEPADTLAARPQPSALPARPAEEVRITFLRAYRDEGTLVAEFQVTNGSREIISYSGYGKGDNVSWSVRSGKRSVRFSPFCGTGLNGYSLYTGDSATFRVVLDGPGYVQAGFDFLVGEKSKRQTIWSDEVLVPEL